MTNRAGRQSALDAALGAVRSHPTATCVAARSATDADVAGPTASVRLVARYFAVRWHHDEPDDPVRIFEELDEERFETRKVEEFADGRLLRTDRIAPESGATLSWEPIPLEEEIARQEEFTVEPLSAEQFQDLWERAVHVRG